MSKFLTAIGIGILPALAGLVYPVFYRNDGKLYVLFAAFAAGAVLAVGVQNLSYSILYSWSIAEEVEDMYNVAQHVMLQFAIFLFLRYCMSSYYKDLLEQLSPSSLENDCSESEGLLQDSREHILAPTVFDGSSDLMGSCLISFSLAIVPMLVGFSIGASPFSHGPTLVAYSMHRVAGAVALARSLDLRSTPSMYSWMSLISYSFSFPIGIIIGSIFERDYATGFLVTQCIMTAAILLYDVLAEHLPRITKSSKLIFSTNGEFYVYAAFSCALILFLVLATTPPSFLHGEKAKHLNGGIFHHGINDPLVPRTGPAAPAATTGGGTGGQPYYPPANNAPAQPNNPPAAGTPQQPYYPPANTAPTQPNYYPPTNPAPVQPNYPPANTAPQQPYYPPAPANTAPAQPNSIFNYQPGTNAGARYLRA